MQYPAKRNFKPQSVSEIDASHEAEKDMCTLAFVSVPVLENKFVDDKSQLKYSNSREASDTHFLSMIYPTHSQGTAWIARSCVATCHTAR